MKILRKREKDLRDFVVSKSDFDYVQDEISAHNRKVVQGFAYISLVFLFILLGMTFVVEMPEKYRLFFSGYLVFTIWLLILTRKTAKQSLTTTKIATYALAAGMMLYGIMISYSTPDQRAVAFVAVLPFVAMLFVDKPKIMAIAISLGTIAFLIMVYSHKAESVRLSDTVSSVSVAILSIVNGWVVIHVRVRGYVTGKKLKYMSEMDQLTDLYNRNSYESMINSCTLLSGQTLGCIYIDVNGLHELNNTKGHQAGDDMLRFIAQAIRDTFGRENTYRIGGDEFVAFIIDGNRVEIEKKLDAMRSVISERGYHVSVGFEYCEGNILVQDTIKRAEQKMYEEKQNFYANNSVADRRKAR